MEEFSQEELEVIEGEIYFPEKEGGKSGRNLDRVKPYKPKKARVIKHRDNLIMRDYAGGAGMTPEELADKYNLSVRSIYLRIQQQRQRLDEETKDDLRAEVRFKLEALEQDIRAKEDNGDHKNAANIRGILGDIIKLYGLNENESKIADAAQITAAARAVQVKENIHVIKKVLSLLDLSPEQWMKSDEAIRVAVLDFKKGNS